MAPGQDDPVRLFVKEDEMPSRLIAAAIAWITVLAASGAGPPALDPMFPDGCVHDFGIVSRGPPVRHTFRVINTTGVRLEILSVRSG
jgi:hypothetical protein